ncbi:MAG: hypothetical protein ACI8S6_003496 [Myxococcota bacterium]
MRPPREEAPEALPEAPEISLESLFEELDKPLPLPEGVCEYAPPAVPSHGDSSTFYENQSRRLIAGQIKLVVSEAGPIHRDDVINLIRISWGFGRGGKKIQNTITGAVSLLQPHLRPILSEAGWYWPVGMDAGGWRGFRTSPDGGENRRKVQRICSEELANVMGWLLQGAKSLSEEELCREAAGQLGWQAGTGVRKEMMRGLAHLLATERARDQDGMIVIVD